MKFFWHKKKYNVLLISFVIITFFLFILFDAFYAIATLFSCIIYPILFLYEMGHNTYESLRLTKTAKNELTTQLIEMTDQRDTILQKLIALQSTIAYATETEMLPLSTHLYKDIHTVATGRIMIKHFTEHEHFFLLDAGTTKGVAVDMVVVYKNTLIGKIVAVYPWYSKVLLISDRQTKISVFIGKEDITAIYNGQNNEKEGALIFVNHPERVPNQELIISSGQGMIFPYGFALGTVHKKKDEQIVVDFFSDMKDMRYCSVVTKQVSYNH